MKVLLINPPSTATNPVLPLGLAYLAATLEAYQMPVDVIDAWAEGYSFEELGTEVAKRAPDIVGITMMSPIYASAMRSVDIVRKYSDAKIVVGGPHPSALPEQCLEDNPNIDFVIIGEGEKPLVELVAALSESGKHLSAISGLAYRDNRGIINTGHAERVSNLDDLPFPARHLFPLKKYKTHPPYGKRNPYMTLITSRGCPYHCAYCSKSVYGQKYQAMSPERVIVEIKHIIQEYSTKEIHFYDDDFTINMKRAEKICDLLIEEKINISWSCTTRVDLINESLLKKMKKAGCWLISYGVETADPDILEKIRKGYTIKDVKNAFSLTKKAGIRTVGYFMLGLPGETRGSFEKTLDFSLKLNPDFVSWGVTALFPGSSLYTSAKKGELGKINTDYDRSLTQSWHATGSPFGDGRTIILEESFSRKQLEEWAQKANRKFYFRLFYLLGFLFKIRSFYEFVHYLKGGLRVIKFVLDIKKTAKNKII